MSFFAWAVGLTWPTTIASTDSMSALKTMM